MRILHTLLALTAALLALPLLVLVVALSGVDESARIQKTSPAEMGHLKTLANFIVDFKKTHHRRPDGAEFYGWIRKQRNSGFFGDEISYSDPAPRDVPRKFGDPPADGFTVCFGRGGGLLCVPSWGIDSGLAYVPDSLWFHFGSRTKDLLALCTPLLLLVVVAIDQSRRALRSGAASHPIPPPENPL